MTNALCDLIEKCKTTGDYTSTEEFYVAPITENNYKGFMVFSNLDEDKYTKEEISKFSKYKQKFEKYPQKHRYFACYKLSDKSKSIIFIMFNPSHAIPEDSDNSIKNCLLLAQKTEKYGTVEILNLFSLRKPSKYTKTELCNNNDTNVAFITDYLRSIVSNESVDVVLAWGYGKNKEYSDIIDKVKNSLKNKKNSFIIGIDAQKANKKIHHANSQVWNGIGEFDDIAILVPYCED